MLDFGYKRGVPADVETAWGCRASVEQNGYVEPLLNDVELVGPDSPRLADHMTNYVRSVWCDSASLLLRNKVMRVEIDREFVLYDDSTVVIKGNTQASDRFLYVCAYFRPRCTAAAHGWDGPGTCGELLDEHGRCPRASDHKGGER